MQDTIAAEGPSIDLIRPSLRLFIFLFPRGFSP